jgi:hypothetical protein
LFIPGQQRDATSTNSPTAIAGGTARELCDDTTEDEEDEDVATEAADDGGSSAVAALFSSAAAPSVPVSLASPSSSLSAITSTTSMGTAIAAGTAASDGGDTSAAASTEFLCSIAISTVASLVLFTLDFVSTASSTAPFFLLWASTFLCNFERYLLIGRRKECFPNSLCSSE